jgi:hypothetical protein
MLPPPIRAGQPEVPGAMTVPADHRGVVAPRRSETETLTAAYRLN